MTSRNDACLFQDELVALDRDSEAFDQFLRRREQVFILHKRSD
jgi:hypothetical protein